MSTAVYVSVGNTDDRLPQARWASLCDDVGLALYPLVVRHRLAELHGPWFTAGDAERQSAVWCLVIPPENVPRAQPLLGDLRLRLAVLASTYGQESVAWTSGETELIVSLETQARLRRRPALAAPAALVSRSCPACRSIGAPRDGCTDAWHDPPCDGDAGAGGQPASAGGQAGVGTVDGAGAHGPLPDPVRRLREALGDEVYGLRELVRAGLQDADRRGHHLDRRRWSTLLEVLGGTP